MKLHACNCELQIIAKILEKINKRLNTYYGTDDCREGHSYANGATKELIIIKDFINSLIKITQSA